MSTLTLIFNEKCIESIQYVWIDNLQSQLISFRGKHSINPLLTTTGSQTAYAPFLSQHGKLITHFLSSLIGQILQVGLRFRIPIEIEN